jgi:hypothetical protein
MTAARLAVSARQGRRRPGRGSCDGRSSSAQHAAAARDSAVQRQQSLLVICCSPDGQPALAARMRSASRSSPAAVRLAPMHAVRRRNMHNKQGACPLDRCANAALGAGALVRREPRLVRSERPRCRERAPRTAPQPASRCFRRLRPLRRHRLGNGATTALCPSLDVRPAWCIVPMTASAHGSKCRASVWCRGRHVELHCCEQTGRGGSGSRTLGTGASARRMPPCAASAASSPSPPSRAAMHVSASSRACPSRRRRRRRLRCACCHACMRPARCCIRLLRAEATALAHPGAAARFTITPVSHGRGAPCVLRRAGSGRREGRSGLQAC